MNSCFLFYSALSLQFDCRKLVVNVISSIGHDIFHKSNILPYSSGWSIDFILIHVSVHMSWHFAKLSFL